MSACKKVKHWTLSQGLLMLQKQQSNNWALVSWCSRWRISGQQGDGRGQHAMPAVTLSEWSYCLLQSDTSWIQLWESTATHSSPRLRYVAPLQLWGETVKGPFSSRPSLHAYMLIPLLHLHGVNYVECSWLGPKSAMHITGFSGMLKENVPFSSGVCMPVLNACT